MHTSLTHLLSPADILWKILEEYGFDAGAVFLEQDIDREMILKPGMRISQVKADGLWAKVTELIEDPCFGIRAVKFWHPSHFNALGYAWLASGTLREALNRTSRYAHIVGEDREIRVDDMSEGMAVTLSTSFEVPALMDLSMAILMSACRLNYGKELNPVAVNFMHPRPICSQEHDSFFNVQVTFNADSDRLILPATAVDKRLPVGNPFLAGQNEQFVISYLDELEKRKITPLVKSTIIEMIPSGGVSDENVARKLNVSTRNLQRKLQSDNTTFRTLLDEVRQDLANIYLHDPTLSLMEIAFLLGYSEYSSFSRAYKRWTKISPSKARHYNRGSILPGPPQSGV